MENIFGAYMNVIFLWIPKNAGTSIYNHFKEYGCVKQKRLEEIKPNRFVTFGHISLLSLLNKRILSEDFVSNAYIFAFVRNPYARLVSLYKFKNKRRNLSFKEFCEKIIYNPIPPIGSYNYKGLSQANPQYHWLLGNFNTSFIGHVENIDNNIKIVSKDLKIPQKPIKNLNQTSHAHYKTYYTKELKEEVYQYYKKDFEIFGYSK